VEQGTDKVGRKDPQWAISRVSVLRLLAVMLVMVALGALACGDQEISRARNAEKRGDTASAIDLYRAHLKKEPDDLAVLRLLAADLYLGGSFDEALPVQEKVIALDARDAQTRIELGFNYLNHQHLPAKAVAVLAQAVALDSSAKYLTFLAQAQIVAGHQGSAEQTLRRALSVDERYGHAYSVLASLLRTEGRTAEAAALLDVAAGKGVDVGASAPG
jgi:tetratricopeptide (TPR) repeat protein